MFFCPNCPAYLYHNCVNIIKNNILNVITYYINSKSPADIFLVVAANKKQLKFTRNLHSDKKRISELPYLKSSKSIIAPAAF